MIQNKITSFPFLPSIPNIFETSNMDRNQNVLKSIAEDTKFKRNSLEEIIAHEKTAQQKGAAHNNNAYNNNAYNNNAYQKSSLIEQIERNASRMRNIEATIKATNFGFPAGMETSLNNHIEEQNKEGWVLKSMEIVNGAIEFIANNPHNPTMKCPSVSTGLILIWEKTTE